MQVKWGLTLRGRAPKAPALQGGYGLFAETADLGMGAVVSPLPALEPTAPERHPDGAPGALVSLVRPALHVGLGERVDDAVAPGGGQVMGRSGQCRRGPQQSAERVGEDLDVHAVAFVFPGVVRGVGGDPVDRQPGAVQDHEGFRPYGPHRLGQGRRGGGQDVDHLTYVSVHGRDANAEPGGEPRVGVPAPQVGEDEQGLTADRQPSPPGPDLSLPGTQPCGSRWDGMRMLVLGFARAGRWPSVKVVRNVALFLLV